MAREEPHPLILGLVLLALVAGAWAQTVTPERKEEADRLLEEGRVLLGERRFEEARSRFRQAAKLNPFEVLAPYHLAECEVGEAEGRTGLAWVERATEYLRDAIRVDPEFGGTYFLWGTIGARIANHEMAVHGFTNSLRCGYRITDSRVGLATGTLYLGTQLAAAGVAAPEEVLEILQGAREQLLRLKEDPRFDEITRRSFHRMWIGSLVQLAGIYQRLDRVKDAEEILLRLVGLEPENHLHRFDLGKLRGSAGRFDEALESYREALALSPDPSWLEPLPLIAAIHSQRGEREKAEESFRRYLAVRPDDWAALHRLADHLVRYGELEEAVVRFQRCLELVPTTIGVMERLAAVLEEIGREEEADLWRALYTELARIYGESVDRK